jgi:hypothetical protein
MTAGLQGQARDCQTGSRPGAPQGRLARKRRQYGHGPSASLVPAVCYTRQLARREADSCWRNYTHDLFQGILDPQAPLSCGRHGLYLPSLLCADGRVAQPPRPPHEDASQVNLVWSHSIDNASDARTLFRMPRSCRTAPTPARTKARRTSTSASGLSGPPPMIFQNGSRRAAGVRVGRSAAC